MLKKNVLISVISIVVIMLSLVGCGDVKDQVTEQVKNQVDEAISGENSVVNKLLESVAKDEGVSEKELENILEGLAEVGAEKYGISVEEYKKDIESDGGSLLEEWQGAAEVMGMSIKELYEVEKASLENMTDEQKETMAGMSEALDMAKDLLEDLDVDGEEKTEAQAIADIEALLGIESNTSGEIRIVEVDAKKAFDYKVAELYQDYEDDYSYVYEYMSDGKFEELSDYYGALVKNTENYSKISAPGNAASVMYSGRVNGMDIYIDIDGTAGNGNIVNAYLDYTSLEEALTPDDFKNKETEDTSKNDDDSTDGIEAVKEIASDFTYSQVSDEFYMLIVGTTTTAGETYELEYDTYFRDTDVRIETYWDGQPIATNIYSSDKDITYTEVTHYTHYAEVINGNVMPIRLLDFDELEAFAADEDVENFVAEYRTLNLLDVFYVEATMDDGSIMAFWYSLEYLVPVKFHEEMMEEGELHVVDWEAAMINEMTLEDDLFEIPADSSDATSEASDYFGEEDDEDENEVTGNTDEDSIDAQIRTQLLYNVQEITYDEKNMDGALTQILFYTESEYDEIIAYYVSQLEGSFGYALTDAEEQTFVDGTLQDAMVMVIVDKDKGRSKDGVIEVNLNWMEE